MQVRADPPVRHLQSSPEVGVEEVAEWADHYRRFWDASYERLDTYLQTLEGKGEHG